MEEPRSFPFDQFWIWYWIGGLFAVGALIALAGTIRRLQVALVSTVVAVLCLVEGTNYFILPRMDFQLTGHNLGMYVQTLPANMIDHVCIFELDRSAEFSLNYYYHRELPTWSIQQSGCHDVFASLRGINDLEKQGVQTGKGIRFFKDVYGIHVRSLR